MALSESQLRGVMKFQLRNFNTTGSTITNETIHSDILSDDDGFGHATSQRLYKASIRWTLATSGDNDRSWPSEWMDQSVKQLAKLLLED